MNYVMKSELDDIDPNEGWVSTEKLARELGIGVDLVRRWRNFPGFPREASKRAGLYTVWHRESVFAWARKYPVDTTTNRRFPTWLAVVGHPMAKQAAESGKQYWRGRERMSGGE